MSKTMDLCVDRCARHNCWAISIEDESGGTRLTSGKCCGSWTTQTKWKLDAAKLKRLIADLQTELDQLEKTP